MFTNWNFFYNIYTSFLKVCLLNEWEKSILSHLYVQRRRAWWKEHILDFIIGLIQEKNDQYSHNQDSNQGTYKRC